MIVHYRLPNQGWLNPHSLIVDDLWLAHWDGTLFYVSTETEFDFLEGYGLAKGYQLNVTLSPTFDKTGPLGCCLWLKDINTNPRIRTHERQAASHGNAEHLDQQGA